MPARHLQRVAAIALIATALAAGGCQGGTRSYERVGTAGAILFLTGSTASIAGVNAVARHDERLGATTAGVGVVAQVTGLLMLIYALDAIMQASAP